MKAKRITALLMALTLTAALSACGKSSKSSVSANKETENKAKGSVTEMGDSVVDDKSEVSDMAVLADNEVTEDAVDMTVETTEEAVEAAEEENTEEVLNSQDVQMETRSASSNSDSNNSASSKSKSDSSSSGTSASGNSSSSSGTSGSSVPVSSTSSSESSGSGTTTSNPVNTHTHNWKEHTATQQVWVSNMVTVDDYEDKVVDNGYCEGNCGKRFDLDDIESLEEHAKANMLEAARNGVKSECGGYHDKQTERVKVGSHQEDHGHYETSTYVDYYYCDCGARK